MPAVTVKPEATYNMLPATTGPLPLIEPPCVKQIGLGIEEILDLVPPDAVRGPICCVTRHAGSSEIHYDIPRPHLGLVA